MRQPHMLHTFYRSRWNISYYTVFDNGRLVDEWSAHGRKNMFSQPVSNEMQSNQGHPELYGSLAAELLQQRTPLPGLLLMIPNMYKIWAFARRFSCIGKGNRFTPFRYSGIRMLWPAARLVCSYQLQMSRKLWIWANRPFMRYKIPNSVSSFFDGSDLHEQQKIELLIMSRYGHLSIITQLMSSGAFAKPERPTIRAQHKP